MEWVIDASGCDPGSLNSVAAPRAVCEQVLQDLQLKVVMPPQWHQFPGPGGVTGMYLLSESHLTCHTYPEFGCATFNLYCCRERAAWDWQEHLARMLGATRVGVRQFERGQECSVTERLDPASEARL